MKRRTVLHHLATTLGAAAAATALGRAVAQPARRLRLGIIGTGLRGQVLLAELLKRDDVDIAALCDIEPIMLRRAMAAVARAGRAEPQTWGVEWKQNHSQAAAGQGDPYAYERMLTQASLDGVIIATPWEWHAPMAMAALKAGVPVGCEVVAGITLQDHWDVLHTQQRTGTPYMLLENVCYRRDVMAALQMVRAGLFGELVHLQGGYQHDLRGVKFNSGHPDQPYDSGAEFGEKGWSEARWRTAHSVHRNGDLYPSHGIGPLAMMLDIHRGNRFTHINAFSSQARGLQEYVRRKGGADHPNAKQRFALGDVVTTTLRCENGQTIILQHDTSLPRPYSLGFRVQGTRGLWMEINKSIHIEGRSAPHRWDEAATWFREHDHPLWRRHAARAEGAGHGGMDFFVVHAFVEALKARAPMPIDIHDAIAWSAITPLSEQSIAQNHATLPFPDFTGGRWASASPVFAPDDRY